MARTAIEIVEDASARINPWTQGTGYITRQDLVDFFVTLPEDANRKSELTLFLDQCTFLTTDEKEKIISDVGSYA